MNFSSASHEVYRAPWPRYFPRQFATCQRYPLLFFLGQRYVNGNILEAWKPAISLARRICIAFLGKIMDMCQDRKVHCSLYKVFFWGVSAQRKIQSRKISREWCMMYSFVFRMITRWDWWIYGSQFGKTHLWWWVAADQRMSAPSWKAAWHQFQQMTSRPEIGVYTLIVEKIYIIYSCVRVWIGKKQES